MSSSKPARLLEPPATPNVGDDQRQDGEVGDALLVCQ